MSSKTILITGSTDGIGKATAIALAKQGHTVIIHGRNRDKAEKVCQEIKAETGNKNIEFVIADLLQLSDIKRMTVEFKKKYDHLDALINNAGAISGKERLTTKEGFERTMTLNVFAPMLLTELLLDVLAKNSSARIVNLSSASHKMGGKPNLNDMQFAKNYSFSAAYGHSKLYLIWLTQYLAKDLKRRGYSNITANAVHPGMVKTDFGQSVDKGFFGNMLFKIAVPLFGVSIEEGAAPSVYAASSPEAEGVTGKYFGPKGEEKPSQKWHSLENEKKVRDYVMQVVKPYL